MPTILVADNNVSTLERLENTLLQEGHKVIGIRELYQVVPVAREQLPDLIILGLDFPNNKGLILCHELRSLPHLTHVPILFLTANRNEIVPALDAGGDDLLIKPVIPAELTARIRALLRRSYRKSYKHVIKVDSRLRTIHVDQKLIDLTPTEFDLMEYLCLHSDQYHQAADLLHSVWNYPPDTGDTALVRNHIHNIRTKIEVNPNRPQILTSLHGRGYRVKASIQILHQDECRN